MYKVINLRNEMDNYRYNPFNPEEKLSEKREFEGYKSSKSNDLKFCELSGTIETSFLISL